MSRCLRPSQRRRTFFSIPRMRRPPFPVIDPNNNFITSELCVSDTGVSAWVGERARRLRAERQALLCLKTLVRPGSRIRVVARPVLCMFLAKNARIVCTKCTPLGFFQILVHKPR